MNNLNFIKHLNDKYKFGNFELMNIWAIESIINNAVDESVHKILIHLEVNNFNDCFSGIIALPEPQYSKEFKGEFLLFLYKSKNFIDVFSEIQYNSIQVSASTSYSQCIALYEDNMISAMMRVESGADVSTTKLMIREHLNWISGIENNPVNIDIIKSKGLIQNSTVDIIKKNKQKKNK